MGSHQTEFGGENDGGGEIGEAEGGKPQLFGSLEGMEKEFL